jgi:hypothetical protein
MKTENIKATCVANKIRMKQSIFLAISTLMLTGCEIKVEVPINRAGVVITKDGEVKDQVLRPGKQIVRTDSKVPRR